MVAPSWSTPWSVGFTCNCYQYGCRKCGLMRQTRTAWPAGLARTICLTKGQRGLGIWGPWCHRYWQMPRVTVAPNRRPAVPRHYLRRVDISKTLQVLSIVNIRSSAMTNPVRASNTPFAVKVEQGKDYWWCACGQSKNQPFCGGTHKGSTFSPVKYSPDVSKEVHFCGCKGTASPPLCDGSHKKPV